MIESVLRYYFKHAELNIEQCPERRVEILGEQRNRLGLTNSQLGESLVLGERVRDRGGKFRIHIRQLDWNRFHEFLPIGSGYQPLCALVRFTLRDPLDYDLRRSFARTRSVSCASAPTTTAASAGPAGSDATAPTAWSPWAARLIKEDENDQR